MNSSLWVSFVKNESQQSCAQSPEGKPYSILRLSFFKSEVLLKSNSNEKFGKPVEDLLSPERLEIDQRNLILSIDF